MFVYFCPCGSTEKVLLAVRVLFYFEPLQAACFNYTFTNPHYRGEKLLTQVNRLLSHAITHTYPEAKGVITVTSEGFSPVNYKNYTVNGLEHQGDDGSLTWLKMKALPSTALDKINAPPANYGTLDGWRRFKTISPSSQSH